MTDNVSDAILLFALIPAVYLLATTLLISRAEEKKLQDFLLLTLYVSVMAAIPILLLILLNTMLGK